MSQQITFFQKNRADYSDTKVIATASEGNLFAPLVLNRNNTSGWGTSGSVDANNTTLTIDFGDTHTLTDLLLVKHNFKSFTAKYWDGAAWQDFSPAIAPTNCTDSTSRFSFSSVLAQKILITVLGTQVPNSDKSLCQVIATQLIGQLTGWPVIKKPTHNRNKRITTMLSGKQYIAENVGGFAADLVVTNWSSSADLSIVENLFDSNEGFLVWLGGGDETQFSSIRQGYRKEDLYLMRCSNNYMPEWAQGFYKSGLAITISLQEVVR